MSTPLWNIFCCRWHGIAKAPGSDRSIYAQDGPLDPDEVLIFVMAAAYDTYWIESDTPIPRIRSKMADLCHLARTQAFDCHHYNSARVPFGS